MEQDSSNISTLEPSILGESFLCFLLIFVVPEEDSRASEPYFPPGSRVTILVLVLAGVLHFRDIN